jgi:hypothetical protein
MTMVLLLVAVVAVAVAVIHLMRTAGVAIWRSRGERVIDCPETQESAAVHLDGKHAAATALRGKQELQLSDCTRWPQRAGCGQECLAQIEDAPDGCLVTRILAAWYEGKTCALCGREFGRVDWSTNKPAILDAERRTWEWREFPAAEIPEILRTHQPVCWDCHIIESLIRKHPDRVTYRT